MNCRVLLIHSTTGISVFGMKTFYLRTNEVDRYVKLNFMWGIDLTTTFGLCTESWCFMKTKCVSFSAISVLYIGIEAPWPSDTPRFLQYDPQNAVSFSSFCFDSVTRSATIQYVLSIQIGKGCSAL